MKWNFVFCGFSDEKCAGRKNTSGEQKKQLSVNTQENPIAHDGRPKATAIYMPTSFTNPRKAAIVVQFGH